MSKNKTAGDANEEILSSLSRRGPDALDVLVEALEGEGDVHKGVIEKIRKGLFTWQYELFIAIIICFRMASEISGRNKISRYVITSFNVYLVGKSIMVVLDQVHIVYIVLLKYSRSFIMMHAGGLLQVLFCLLHSTFEVCHSKL